MATLLESQQIPMTQEVFRRILKNVRMMNRTEAVEINRVSRRVKVQPGNSRRPAAIPYDKLVLATGARPIRPSLPARTSPTYSRRTACVTRKASAVISTPGAPTTS